MTDHRWRLPVGERMTELDLIGSETADLFPAAGADEVVHPTFTARAAIWRDQRAGLISISEAQRRSAAIGAPAVQKAGSLRVMGRATTPVRPRQSRPAPHESRQYAPPMATTAARDDRLTPNAKALLQILRARCGNARITRTTKATLGAIMARSTRTVRRYLGDLEALGYVVTETARTARGLHLGLVVTITEKALPFFAEPAGLARWLAETRPLADLPFGAATPVEQGVTLPSPKNHSVKTESLRGRILAWKTIEPTAKPPGWAVLRPQPG